MSLRYPIPAAPHREIVEIRRSRFIASAAPATSVEDARAFLAEVRAEFPDAAHHVYAFVVGHGASVTRGMSDDGEPSGTAGRPTMAVVEGSGLGDVCVVTTRYFGGTKLGTGGLVRAYTEAAQLVLAHLPRGIHESTREARITLPYALLDIVKRILDAHEVSIEAEDYGADVRLQLRMAVDRFDDLAAALGEASSGSLSLEPVDD